MNWEVDPESGSVSNRDLDIQCGFELGDWYSFTSLNSGNLSGTRLLREYDHSQSFYRADHEITLHSGSGIVTQSEEFGEHSINRTLILEPTSPIFIGDFVLRFVVDAHSYPVAQIAGKTFEHQGKNRYLQFDVAKAQLQGEQGTISFEAGNCSLPDEMSLVVYVRDQPPDQWVIHIRALARSTGEGFVRLYNNSVKRLPALDEIIRLFGLIKFLRYCREYGTRVWYLPNALPFQYVEYIKLDPTDVLEICATCQIDSGLQKPKNNMDGI